MGMGFLARVGVGVTGQGRPAGPRAAGCGLRSWCGGWITEHHCHLVAAHTWTAGKLGPKHAPPHPIPCSPEPP